MTTPHGRSPSRETLSNRPLGPAGVLPYVSPTLSSQPFPSRQDHDQRTTADDVRPEYELETIEIESLELHHSPPPPPLFHPNESEKDDINHGNLRFGSSARSEKGNYHKSRTSSPSGGLGQWTSPGSTTPYGPLGERHAPGISSGLNSAANSQLNLHESLEVHRSNTFSRFVGRVLESSFLVRWMLYIVPVLVLLFIPAMVGESIPAFRSSNVWGVPLLWWSVWLGGFVWCGWWGAALVVRMLPFILRGTVSIIAPASKHWEQYTRALQLYIGAATWSIINWATIPIILTQHAPNPNPSAATMSLFTQGFFGVWIAAVIMLAEKLLIQMIAHSFHRKSYEDRIKSQKSQIRALVELWKVSRDVGESIDGTPKRPPGRRQGSDPTLLAKSALKGFKFAARSATTVIGAVASEITGEKVMQPNSPESVVALALGSSKKSTALARRIFFSFVPAYRNPPALLLEDIASIFPTRDAAEKAFAVLDRDGNGDASLEEVETACLELHRERKALTSSMHDIDSAVSRLDSIMTGFAVFIAIIIEIGLLNASFKTMIAGAGTLILGFSWLFALTAQEVLSSIIFLFVKHVYDVGDKINVDGEDYIVLEMHLLSTIFRSPGTGRIVQAPHNLLNTKFIHNVRRSGPIAEPFVWDVDFATSFKSIEALKEKMMTFLEQERRDFLPKIEIVVKDFPGCTKMILSADIAYRSNSQDGALKVKRRNLWICTLKESMQALQIYGPGDAGNPTPPPAEPIVYKLIGTEKENETSARESLVGGEGLRLR